MYQFFCARLGYQTWNQPGIPQRNKLSRQSHLGLGACQPVWGGWQVAGAQSSGGEGEEVGKQPEHEASATRQPHGVVEPSARHVWHCLGGPSKPGVVALICTPQGAALLADIYEARRKSVMTCRGCAGVHVYPLRVQVCP